MDTMTAEPVLALNPPANDFYAKFLDCNGIPVRSSASVDDRALRIACGKIVVMLEHISRVRHALMRRHAELHIVGRNERISRLPEFRGEQDKDRFDARARGYAQGVDAACSEENVLHLAYDVYRGGIDNCVHEFGHLIMNAGFTDAQRRQIETQYEQAMAAGLWPGLYAATNAREYWAELSEWYFGAHGDAGFKDPKPADGPDGLRAYDPDGFALLDRLYNGDE
jgi:hypothetical protein